MGNQTAQNFIDLAGQKFGKLTVIEQKGVSKYGHATWLCKCDCGNRSVVLGRNLRNGNTSSCGCLQRERAGRPIEKTTLAKEYSRLYCVWWGMKVRCYNPKHKGYHRYGGRGITVCDEWINDFQSFCDWAMANGYDENAPRGKCTIDRIDNDKGYSPANCRWVDMKVQNQNREMKQN